MGLFLGIISNFNLNKGRITLKINEPIEIGDTISIESEQGTYTVSEIISSGTENFSTKSSKNKFDKNSNYNSGKMVTLGRMKGNFKKGLKVYKMSSKKLDNIAISSYSNVENKKILLNCNLEIHLNEPIKIFISTINCENSFYNNINFEIISDIIPELALKSPISEDRIKTQLEKTTNTPYEFKNIKINMDNNLYIPHIADINNLRRTCLEKLQNIIIKKYCQNTVNLTYSVLENLNSLDTLDTQKNSKSSLKVSKNPQNIAGTIRKPSEPKIAILLNKLNSDYNYCLLKNIDKVYIPLKYFLNSNYSKVLKNLSDKFNTYIYLPVIMKENYKRLLNLNLQKILISYNIKGFLISNLGNLRLLETLNLLNNSYDLVGNYSLNVFNNHTIIELKNIGINTITLSPELSENDFNYFTKDFISELIVYGKIPIMNINYCPLSKSNKCLNTCKHYCMNNKKYYLIDRLGFKFEIISDFGDCITTIYNSKTLSIIPPKDVTFLRLDFIYENIDEINSIVDFVKNGKKLEGSEYTNGNWFRDV